jgi:putative ABC transport system ATP-binding protein
MHPTDTRARRAGAASDPHPALLHLEAVSKSYGGAQRVRVLSSLDFALARGEYVAIGGDSGVGKSTLLNLIAGLDLPDAGSITLDGVNLSALDDDARTRLRRDRMGFVFQAFHLLPHLTALQNAALPLRLAGASREQSEKRAAALLDALGIGTLAPRYPRTLSGGETQRVAIARALVHRPALVLADEPTGNLDPASARVVLRLLRDAIKQNAGSGILVTHSASAAATADRAYVLTPEGMRLREPPT